MGVIRPKDEPAATSAAAGDIFLIDGATGVRGLAATSVAYVTGANTFTGTQTVPVLVATTVNGNTITTGTGTLSLGSKTLTVSNTLTLTGTDGSNVALGAGGTVAYQGGTLAQFAATTSAQLAGILSDETGTGAAVFANAPTLVNPIVGTQSPGDNTTKAASTAFVAAAVGATGVTSINGQTGALAGLLTGTRLAKTAAYTVLNADDGKTIALGGTAFYTLTFGAASGYDATFSARVVNEDSGRAKYITLSGSISFYLWPLQSVTVHSQNNVWYIEGRSRWKLPGGALTINTDFVNGSDTLGVADGLATGAVAFKTVNHALAMLLNEFDFNGTESAQSQVTVLMGADDTQQVHFSPHSLVGAQGGAAVKIDMGTHKLGTTTSSDTLQLYFGAVLQIRNGTLATGGGSSIQVNWGAKLFVLDQVTFGTTNADIWLNPGGIIELDNNYAISGSRSYHIVNAGGSLKLGGAITATLANSMTVTQWVNGQAPCITDLASMTWNLNSFTITATNKYAISNCNVLTGSANIPGSGAASVTTGAQAV